MPIILGPDGPSLGGFVCPFVIIQADLWKVGQLAPGDEVRFEVVDDESARYAELEQDNAIAALEPADGSLDASRRPLKQSPILRQIEPIGARPCVVYRRQGDRHLL